MKIIFADNIGSCFGVERAINITNKSLKNDPKPVQFFGNLIHNERVINKIKDQGGEFIEKVDQIKNGTVLVRAHGIPLKTFEKIKKKGVVIRDTTCPFVKKAQDKALSFSENGYQVIIIGEENHSEVKGINSYTKNKGIIVGSREEVKKLDSFEKIGVVCQTTQRSEKVFDIIEILKEKSKELEWENTLCSAVFDRQKELLRILKKVDGVVVIGSRSSSNTTNLTQYVKDKGKKLWWINSKKELKKSDFKNVSLIGVISGTSAPNWEVQEIKDWFLNNFPENE